MPQSRILRFTILLTVMVGLMFGGACAASPVSSEGINVVATTGMIADAVRNVGGARLNVVQLMGAGVDPHLYTATESDVSRLLDAEIIIYNGLHLESRMADIFEQMASSRPTVPVGERIPQDRIVGVEGFDIADPHIWMDVALWSAVSQIIEDTLVEFDPAGAEVYQANGAQYRAALADLDAEVRRRIASIPEEQRLLVTAHDAFQYYGLAYGIDVFAPQGITTEAEAGIDDIRRVIDLMVARNIPAIFIESSVPPDIVEAIVEGARARGHQVAIGGELFSDAMGDPGSSAGTYIGMIRHNTEAIVSALGGQ